MEIGDRGEGGNRGSVGDGAEEGGRRREREREGGGRGCAERGNAQRERERERESSYR